MQGNGKIKTGGSNTTIRLAEARALTPPVDPVAAVKQSLVTSLYGRIGDEDVEQLVDSIKEQALAGDKQSRKLLLDLVTRATPAPRESQTVERVVYADPGSKQLRLLAAYMIAHQGPTPTPALAHALGMAEEDAHKLLEASCWLRGTSAGWVLTTEGKQQVG